MYCFKGVGSLQNGGSSLPEVHPYEKHSIPSAMFRVSNCFYEFYVQGGSLLFLEKLKKVSTSKRAHGLFQKRNLHQNISFSLSNQ